MMDSEVGVVSDASVCRGTFRFAGTVGSGNGIREPPLLTAAERTNPDNTLILDFSLQSCETMHFYC